MVVSDLWYDDFIKQREMKEESLAGPAGFWMAQTQGGTGSLSSLLALARDLHTFLWESIKGTQQRKEKTNALLKVSLSRFKEAPLEMDDCSCSFYYIFCQCSPLLLWKSLIMVQVWKRMRGGGGGGGAEAIVFVPCRCCLLPSAAVCLLFYKCSF